jgi:hypothetical protein
MSDVLTILSLEMRSEERGEVKGKRSLLNISGAGLVGSQKPNIP